MEIFYCKIVLAFKFVLVFHLLCYFIFSIEGKKFNFSLLDYFLIVVCIFFRYILIVLTLFYLPLVLVFFTLSLIFFKEVRLGFSKKYIDESRLSLTAYLLFIKLPFAASEFLVYTLLRITLSRGDGVGAKISLRSFLLNMVFVNLFGSPKWLFKLSLSLSSDILDALNNDLSSKNCYYRPLIRYNLIVTYINSRICSDCNYFLSKCNESRIIKKDDGIIFNMFNFSLRYRGGHFISNNRIMSAVTHTKNGRILNHPIYDNSFESDTSNGTVYTHFPMKGQRSIAFTDNDGNWHYGVYNNAQEESLINTDKRMNLNQSKERSDLERKVVQTAQFIDEGAIYFQGKDKTGLLEHSYKDLKEDEAKKLGFKEKKLIEFATSRKKLTFESQSDEDIFRNEMNYALSDRPNHICPESCSYGLDSKNISNLEKLKHLDGKQIISRLSYEKYKRNE